MHCNVCVHLKHTSTYKVVSKEALILVVVKEAKSDFIGGGFRCGENIFVRNV